MKKIVFALAIVFVLISSVYTVVFASDTFPESSLLPDTSKYVGEATVWITVSGQTMKDKNYYWTALEVFWPGKDCFTDGIKTVKVSDLSHKSGYIWIKDGNEYCIVKNK